MTVHVSRRSPKAFAESRLHSSIVKVQRACQDHWLDPPATQPFGRTPTGELRSLPEAGRRRNAPAGRRRRLAAALGAGIEALAGVTARPPPQLAGRTCSVRSTGSRGP